MEETLSSLRLTRRRLFPSARWKALSSKFTKSNKKSLRKPSPNLLDIPLEIRLLIYAYLNPSASFSNPHPEHPLYVFFHINKFLRNEVASLFYTNPGFTFSDPRAAGFFLRNTLAHVHLLDHLTISVCGNETYALENIFQLLVEKKAGLRSLVLKLMLVLGETVPLSPPMEMLIPSNSSAAMVGDGRTFARKIGLLFNSDLSSTTLIGPGVADEDPLSFLPRIGSIRYLAIDGHPTAVYAGEFEIAVMQTHLGMFAVAKEEGRRMCKGPSPLPPGYTYDAYWLHNDVWIEGEEKPDCIGEGEGLFLRENYGVWRGARP